MNQKIINIGLNQQNSNLISELADKNRAINDLRLQQAFSSDGSNYKRKARKLGRDLAEKESEAQIAANEIASLKALVADLQSQIAAKEIVLAKWVSAVTERDQLLAEKDALILEWMHSNEAFKHLARQYGKVLGKTDDERVKNFREALVESAEENPNFANTEIGAKAKANLGK